MLSGEIALKNNHYYYDIIAFLHDTNSSEYITFLHFALFTLVVNDKEK